MRYSRKLTKVHFLLNYPQATCVGWDESCGRIAIRLLWYKYIRLLRLSQDMAWVLNFLPATSMFNFMASPESRCLLPCRAKTASLHPYKGCPASRCFTSYYRLYSIYVSFSWHSGCVLGLLDLDLGSNTRWSWHLFLMLMISREAYNIHVIPPEPVGTHVCYLRCVLNVTSNT